MVVTGVVVEPPATGVTLPTPWSIVKLVIFDEVHVKVVLPGDVNEVGAAVKVHTGVGLLTICLFLKRTVEQTGPAFTTTVPFTGVTESIVQFAFGITSVTVCVPGVTLLKRALPAESLTVVVAPFNLKVNCATGVSGSPFVL